MNQKHLTEKDLEVECCECWRCCRDTVVDKNTMAIQEFMSYILCGLANLVIIITIMDFKNPQTTRDFKLKKARKVFRLVMTGCKHIKKANILARLFHK